MKSVLNLTLWLAAFAVPAALAEPVRIAGSGANVGAIGLLAAEFRKQAPSAHFAPIEAIGSEGAVKAVAAGALHIALISRPLSEAERSLGVREIEYARTPFVIAVRADSRLQSVSAEQLAQFLSGTVDSGPDGVRVRPVLRPARDVDTAIVKRMSAPAAPLIEEAIKRPGMMIASTDKEAADMIERTAGAIGGSTLGLMLSEQRRLRALPFDGAPATLSAFESGAYPFHKRLFMVVSDKSLSSQDARRFAEFVASPAAKPLLQRTGHQLPPFAGS